MARALSHLVECESINKQLVDLRWLSMILLLKFILIFKKKIFYFCTQRFLCSLVSITSKTIKIVYWTNFSSINKRWLAFFLSKINYSSNIFILNLESLALIILQQVGEQVFVNLSDMVDVDVAELVDKCLVNLLRPGLQKHNLLFQLLYNYLFIYLLLKKDEKLARVDVDTVEFWVDKQFKVHQKQRKFTSTN